MVLLCRFPLGAFWQLHTKCHRKLMAAIFGSLDLCRNVSCAVLRQRPWLVCPLRRQQLYHLSKWFLNLHAISEMHPSRLVFTKSFLPTTSCTKFISFLHYWYQPSIWYMHIHITFRSNHIPNPTHSFLLFLLYIDLLLFWQINYAIYNHWLQRKGIVWLINLMIHSAKGSCSKGTGSSWKSISS